MVSSFPTTCSPIYLVRPSMSLFSFSDSITSSYLAASGISLLLSSRTSIDFLYAWYFIPLHQLGTLVGFTSLFGLSLFPFTMASVIDCKPANISLFVFVFSMSALYHFLIGVIFFLNKFHEFINSASALFWAATDDSSLLPAHDPSICLPSLSRCSNVGMEFI